MSKPQLESIRVEPAREADACVIWLHGLGADGYDFVDIVPSLDLPQGNGVRFIFPHAPSRSVTLNGHMVMPAWFDIFALDIHAKIDEVGIAEGETLIQELIDEQIQSGIDAKRIVIVGFSQGGALALYTALCSKRLLGGVAGLSTYLPLQAAMMQHTDFPHPSMPIFLAHGLLDPVVPYWMGHQSLACLEEKGYSPLWHSYPIAHTVSLPECEDLGHWIRDILLLR
jgi:phospholipase/carboxylesterase